MKEAILKYYLSDIVNPNNKNNVQGSEINSRIEELRELLLDIFEWRDKGYIVFLPNAYYAKKLLLHFLFNGQKFKDLRFFSNSKKKNKAILEDEEGLEVTYTKKWSTIKDKHFAFFSNELMEVKNKKKGQYLFVETVLDESSTVANADAFIFNILEGVSIFGFRKEMDLDPIVLGSNSATNADMNSYTLVEDFRRLECGTPNVPLILAILSFYKSQ